MSKHNEPFDAAEFEDYRAHGVFDSRVVQVCEDDRIARMVCASCNVQTTVLPLQEAIGCMVGHDNSPAHQQAETALRIRWDQFLRHNPGYGLNPEPLAASEVF